MENEVHIVGLLERIVFQNRENFWTVGRFRRDADGELVTVVGSLPGVSAGESLRVKGRWIMNPRFGEQLEIESFEIRPPVSTGGIQKYLAAGPVKGIGPEMAKRIVERFGDSSLDVIDSSPERLLEVEGIGRKRLEMIRDAWGEQKNVRETLVFLHGLPIGPALAARIYETFKEETVRKVRNDPYILADEVWGIGFQTADRVARELGVEKDSPRRSEAGVLYMLGQLSQSGHVCYPREELAKVAAGQLDLEEEAAESAVGRLLESGAVVGEAVGGDVELIYRVEMLEAEEGVARTIHRLLSDRPAGREIDSFRALQWLESSFDFALGDEQKVAVEAAVEGRVVVVTGGPGTGKTTLVRSLLAILERSGEEVLLAAPTGRAAKKMEEATGKPASTIHRLLEFDPRTALFKRNEENPLSASTLIIDEVSMVDILLMDSLLTAIAPGSRLVLVGDVDQLPSVGPGNVLRDLIESGVVRTARLERIYRQARESRIVVNAHRVNRGEMPIIEGDTADFRFVQVERGEEALDWIKRFLSGEAGETMGLDPLRDVQVLAPMHKGVAGVTNLNRELQALLNPRGSEVRRDHKLLRTGDKVIQLRNNYELDVFNGDVGRITDIDPDKEELEVIFGHRLVRYGFNKLDELTPAYAVSVHKAQGSEYRVVLVPLLGEHYPMLQRNLLYTAITRGRELVVLLGSKRTVGAAVRNNRIRQRYSFLAERLRRAGAER